MGDPHSPTPWPVARKHRRAPLNVHVEIEQGGRKYRGRTANVGEGGLFIHTPFTFAPYTELTIHFALHGGNSVDALAVVRHRKAGAHMGLMFVELSEGARHAIAEHVSKTQPHHRRGSRFARRFDVVLRWHDLGGTEHEESAYTLLVSRYGGSAACAHRFKAGEDAFLWWPEQNRGAPIRIVFRQLGTQGELVEVGFEFKDPAEFWPVEFPPDAFS
ncbi:MAG: PilZ domain-containing protein [Acidobacteria bacterium]|nr:PilZ domain-containing protein [Acidobacteriota bacterium]